MIRSYLSLRYFWSKVANFSWKSSTLLKQAGWGLSYHGDNLVGWKGFQIFDLLSIRSSMSGQKRSTNETSTYSFSSWRSQCLKAENSLNIFCSETSNIVIHLIVLKNSDYQWLLLAFHNFRWFHLAPTPYLCYQVEQPAWQIYHNSCITIDSRYREQTYF